ncbi:Hypothetical predicted protein, partial [Paramuricea clavata]
ACKIVHNTFTNCDVDERRRYCVAAQNLVMAARGRNTARGWRISKDEKKLSDRAELKDTDPASYDDISVFVIPLSKKFQEQPETVHYPVQSKKEQTIQQSEERGDNDMDEASSGPGTNGPLPLSSILLPRESVRVSLPTLRTLVCPWSIYKDLETSSCLDSFPGNSHCHLSGRYLASTSEQERPSTDLLPSRQPTSEPRIYHQAQEVFTSSDAATGIPGGSAGHNEDDNLTSTREVEVNHPRSPPNPTDQSNNFREAIIPYWQNESCCSDRGLESTLILSQPTARPHQCGKHRKRFQVTLSQASMTELIGGHPPIFTHSMANPCAQCPST